MSEVFDNYVNACNYPGKIDSKSVEKSLKNYLESLGIKKKIKQLKRGWSVYDYPDILKKTELILTKIVDIDIKAVKAVMG